MFKPYAKKPVHVKAAQWDVTAEGATPIIDYILSNGTRSARYHGPDAGRLDCPTIEYHETHHYCPSCSFTDQKPAIYIDTLEGTMVASEGDYIIQGVKGEFYPCKPDIFAETYKAVAS